MIELLIKILILKCVFYISFHGVATHYIFKLGHPPYLEDIEEHGFPIAFGILVKTIARNPPPIFRGYQHAFQMLNHLKKL